MSGHLSRRNWILGVSGIPLAPGLAMAAAPAEEAKAKVRPGFPRQDLKLVQQVVGASHRDEAKVRELVAARPALVNAGWDWGFGDCETALGAASHTGRRSIAEFLLEKGARIDIFAAAMLGYMDVVKAFVAAQPGVQRTLGPHGITLLAHAEAGGKPAEKTLDYLKSLGDADQNLKTQPLGAERKAQYVGRYAAEDGTEQFEVKLNKSGQTVLDVKVDGETNTQWIHYAADDEFFPSGVPSVRFRFAVQDGKAQSFTIRVKDVLLAAKRVKD